MYVFKENQQYKLNIIITIIKSGSAEHFSREAGVVKPNQLGIDVEVLGEVLTVVGRVVAND